MFNAVEKYRLPAQIMLGAIAVAFVGFGFASFQIPSSEPYIVKIGSQTITSAALDRAVQNTESAGGMASREAVFQDLVNRAYLLEGAKRLGIAVSDDQIKQIIVDAPQFHDANGKFDANLFRNTIANLHMSEEQFMEEQRSNMAVFALMQTLNSNVSSDFQAQRLYNGSIAPRTVRSFAIEPQAFADKVDASDAELKKYYEAHKQDFALPQAVKFEYIVLSPKALAEKQTVSDAEIEQAYNEAKGSLKPKRRIAHIMIAAPKTADAATREKARAEAEKIAAEAKAAPERFAELAKQSSQDAGTAQNGGELGEFAQDGKLGSKAVEDAAFALEKGAVSGVVESDFGYHIVRVTDITENTLESQKDSIRRSLQEKKAQQAYSEKRKEMADLALKAEGSLKAAADKLGVPLQTQTEWLTRNNAAALNVPQNVAEALFGDGVFVQKHSSEPISADGGSWVVRATETRPAGTETFEQAKARVKEAYILSESRRLARAQADSLLKELQAGKNPVVAWSQPQQVAPMQMQVQFAPDAYAAFLAAVPKNGKPAYAVLEQAGTPQLFEVQSVDTADAAQMLPAVKQRLAQINGDLLLRGFIEAMRAEIPTEQGGEKLSAE